MKSSGLLFESTRNRAVVVEEVLDGLGVDERKFLIENPQYLDVRAEAFLARVAPEWFAQNDLLTDADRERLGELAADALGFGKAA
ncbi:MAG TPA: hypothetical protein VGG89_16810 [Candidatus Baltobacteraceae bacterium]|jgi:hypothetical protein